ncbi:MAG: pentapeptide repeat-containing protein, partial [Candidatus Eremiobacteraeota bacterium]|nr:pentapeptide repeat-containing protein [Candidatus Eremiobacteraeota bacterium]
VWSATLVATVIVPIATTLPFLAQSSSVTMTATAVRVPIPMVTHALTAASSEPRGIPRAPARSAGDTQAALQMSTTPRLPERFRVTMPLPVALAILVLWAALAGFAFLRLAIGLFRLEQLKRDALPLPVEYRDAMARWTAANKGSREVRLCVSDDIDVPVAVGLFDSMILIPRSLLERMSENEVDQISLHELAHLRRADDWTNGLQRVATALFAWNPGVLFVSQQLDLEREVACDDWVLASTGLVRPYAVCLAKMAETSSWPYRPMPAPGVFATRKHISLRIERLLGAGRNAATNLSLGPAAATVAIVGALAFAMQLIAPSVAATMESTKTPSNAVVATHSTALPKPKPLIKYVLIEHDEKVAVAQTPSPAETTAPANTGKKPSAVPAHLHVPAARVTIPTVDVHVPETTVHVPATDIHVPGRTVSIPGIDINLPALRALDAKATAAGASASAAAEASRASAMSYAFGGTHVAQSSSVHNCNDCDLAGVNWAGRDLRGANLSGSDLSRANLQGTDFSGGHFNGVDFSEANLQGASFRNARLTGCDFTRANLSGVDFTGAVLNGCQFSRAQLTSSQLRPVLDACSGCDFSNANLSGLDLTHVRVNGVDFSNANLSGSNMSGSVFTGVDFSGAHFTGAILTNTVFNGCDMSGVDLTHTDLSRTKFIGTDLETRGSPHP